MIIGTKWTWPLGGESSTVSFIDKDTMSLQGSGGQQSFQSRLNWKLIEDYIIEFERKGDWPVSGRIEFNRDFKSAKINLKRKDGQKIETRINRVVTD